MQSRWRICNGNEWQSFGTKHLKSPCSLIFILGKVNKPAEDDLKEHNERSTVLEECQKDKEEPNYEAL